MMGEVVAEAATSFSLGLAVALSAVTSGYRNRYSRSPKSYYFSNGSSRMGKIPPSPPTACFRVFHQISFFDILTYKSAY